MLGPVRLAPRPLVNQPEEGMESPGLGLRHYAPRARVVLVESEQELNAAANREATQRRVGVLLPSGWRLQVNDVIAFDWGRIDDSESLARGLYQGLRALDEQRAEVIIAPLPSPGGLGLAVRDRLLKAAWKM